MTEEDAKHALLDALRYEQVAKDDLAEKARDFQDAKEAAAYAAVQVARARAAYSQAFTASLEEPPC